MLLLLTGYYLRNQNRKIKITCGKNVRRKTVNEGFKNAPEGRRYIGKPRKRWLIDVENDPKKTGVRG
jgi:hypothetical protein